MFNRDDYTFTWKDLGDIQSGRPNLGTKTEVVIYRLLQFSLRSVLINEIGHKAAADIFIKAGRLAGAEFCKNVLNIKLPFNEFIADLQQNLKELQVGILRIEESDLEKMAFTMTVAEDLDCSGLPVSGQEVCDYDEGFIAGILETYTRKTFRVREIDCWASGGRVCRFKATVKEPLIHE